jgi:hypothetical protein
VPSLSATGKKRKEHRFGSDLLSPMLMFSFSFFFPSERNVHDPRALAAVLEKAEEELARKRHPDPYVRAYFGYFSSASRLTPI